MNDNDIVEREGHFHVRNVAHTGDRASFSTLDDAKLFVSAPALRSVVDRVLKYDDELRGGLKCDNRGHGAYGCDIGIGQTFPFEWPPIAVAAHLALRDGPMPIELRDTAIAMLKGKKE